MLNTIALPSFVLGYHGCDHRLAEAVLAGREELRPSRNDYDWLGTGIYFWEHNPQRALDWAAELSRRGRAIDKPAVLGAVIDLGQCLNLLDASALELVRKAHATLAESAALSGQVLPENGRGGSGEDLLLRRLDCMVLNAAMASDPKLTTVRGVFTEGVPLYPGAGIPQKSHIQICVRDTASIIGYFRVRKPGR